MSVGTISETNIAVRLASKKTFANFYTAKINDKYSDFTVSIKISNDFTYTEFKVHRIILANHSDFFQTAFDNKNFKESTTKRMDLNFEDPKGTLPIIFQYMYTGEIIVTPNNIIPIIHFAERLLCMELINTARLALAQFLTSFIPKPLDLPNLKDLTPTNSTQQDISLPLVILKDALDLSIVDDSKNGSSLVSRILHILASRFDEVSINWKELDLSFIPFQIFKEFCKGEYGRLVLDSEFKLYKVVSRYAESRGAILNENGLLSSVDKAAKLLSRKNKSSFLSVGEKTSRPNLSQLSSPPASNTNSYYSSFSSLPSTRSESDLIVHSHNTDFEPLLLTQTQLEELFDSINWEAFSTDEFEMVISGQSDSNTLPNIKIPGHILIMGLLGALKVSKGETVESKFFRQPSRTFKPQNNKSFVFERLGDTNGVVYYLGTRSFKTDQISVGNFVNPQSLGLIKCFMSTVLVGESLNLTSRINIPTCTRCDKDSWITIDFGSSLDINPTSYSLTHGSSRDKFNLRSWQLEGSNDNKTWQIIIKHTNDKNLGGNFQIGHWSISNTEVGDDLNGDGAGIRPESVIDGEIGPGKGKFWRYFRIRTCGRYFLQICNFEIYGVARSEFVL